MSKKTIIFSIVIVLGVAFFESKIFRDELAENVVLPETIKTDVIAETATEIKESVEDEWIISRPLEYNGHVC